MFRYTYSIKYNIYYIDKQFYQYLSNRKLAKQTDFVWLVYEWEFISWDTWS